MNGEPRQAPNAGPKNRDGVVSRSPGQATGAGPDPAFVVANNHAWRQATASRQEHLAAFLSSGTFSQALVTALHRHLLDHTLTALQRGPLKARRSAFARGPGHPAVTHLKLIDPGVRANQVTRLLLAAAAEGAEGSLARTTWRHRSAAGSDWLKLLATHIGHRPADIELLAIRAADPLWPPSPSTSTPATPQPGIGSHTTLGSTRPTDQRHTRWSGTARRPTFLTPSSRRRDPHASGPAA